MSIRWKEQDGVFIRDVEMTEEGFHEKVFMDAEPVLEEAKRMHNDGNWQSESGELRHTAHIPVGIIYEWLHKHGVDFFDPNDEPKWKRLLDTEYTHLKVHPGNLVLRG